MLREFYCSPVLERRILAYLGTVTILAVGLMLAILDAFVNSWYGAFYDLGGQASALLIAANQSTANRTEILIARDAGMAHVTDLLVQFCIVVFPAQLLSPLMDFVMQHFSLTWRLCLMESYVHRCEAHDRGFELEGASQRIHEDTQRFSSSLQRGTTKLLTAFLKLIVFLPRLNQLSGQVPRPQWLLDLAPDALLTDSWLLYIAVGSATIGYSMALYVARHLVGLDVNNQRVEARLRKRLVIAEGDAERLGTPEGDGGAHSSSHATKGDVPMTSSQMSSVRGARVAAGYAALWDDLRENYSKLFINFLSFNVWVGVWMQVPFILPMFLGGTQLFSLEQPIQMGLLVQVSDAFQQTTAALSTGVDRWADVNEFRSVVRRLTEFEATLDGMNMQAASACLREHAEVVSSTGAAAPTGPPRRAGSAGVAPLL